MCGIKVPETDSKMTGDVFSTISILITKDLAPFPDT